MEPILKAEQVSYQYPQSEALAVDASPLRCREFIAILGHNGSGKSTLAKHLNALLKPTGGTVWVKEPWTPATTPISGRYARLAGMVFPEPGQQIVSAVVEEDVAFGPENWA